MRIIRTMLRQKALYWEPLGTPDKFGERGFRDPIVVKVRWEDNLVKDIDANMEEVIFKSMVYVGQDLKLGGKLLGPFSRREDPFEAIDEPLPPPAKALEIKKREKFPTLKANQNLRIVRLN